VGIQVNVSPKLRTPVTTIFFTEDTIGHFSLVLDAINAFLKQQSGETRPGLDELKDKAAHNIQAQI
jgi:hypothetical protein